MDFKFAKRISTLKPSAIREILKVTQDPTVISFAAGNPSAESFPIKEMSEIAADIFENRATQAFQYGISEGYMPLREATAKRLKDKYNSLNEEYDQVIIVSGGQQGIEIAAKILTDDGDVILCESPSFLGALNAFISYGLNLKAIPMDEDGIIPEKLEEILKITDKVKMLYIIPTFQNPSGRTTTLERRKQIYELAVKYNFIILEDNPYGELRYEGSDVPTIKSLDTDGHVIYVGSYSKILSPGVRMGFVCAHKDIISKYVVAKQVSDVHTNQFFMMLTEAFLNKYDLEEHIEKICNMYREKRDIMIDCMKKYFPSEVKYSIPKGGLFIWCELPNGFDSMEFAKIAGQQKVAIVPGLPFEVDSKEISGTFRLNFSLPSSEKIQEGIKILGDELHQFLNKN